MLFYWISCVCSWCMWGAGFPKWINTITSSRWLQHLVPFPVIVLMLYWLLLSWEPRLHGALFISFHTTHTTIIILLLHHYHILPSIKPTIHFSWRSGMIMPQADWTRLFIPVRMVRHARRSDGKWTWHKHQTVQDSICSASIIYVIDTPATWCVFLSLAPFTWNMEYFQFFDQCQTWFLLSLYHLTWLFQAHQVALI